MGVVFSLQLSINATASGYSQQIMETFLEHFCAIAMILDRHGMILKSVSSFLKEASRNLKISGPLCRVVLMKLEPFTQESIRRACGSARTAECIGKSMQDWRTIQRGIAGNLERVCYACIPLLRIPPILLACG